MPSSNAQEQGAQAPAPKTVFERNTQPIELYKSGLGTFTRQISSSNKEAQAFFDQGFQMMYAFAKPEAIRSFRESWKRDPNCAICYWGEAWAWGSYLNGPMSADEAPHAYAAIQKALTLKDKQASAKERAFIDAMAVRYVEKFDPEKRVDQDKAYAEAMGRVADAYPDDLEAATLHADALFLLEPRRGTRDVQEPERPASASRARTDSREGRSSSRRVSSVRPRHRVDRRARARNCVRRVPRQIDTRREPHQPHAVAHMERSGAVGRFRAREPRSVAFRSESGDRRGVRDLPVS